MRLVRAIRRGSERAWIVIHHDPRGEPLPGAVAGEARVRLVPDPVAVTWGDFSMVESVLRSIEWMTTTIAFDWMIYISGQDYPAMPIREIENELDTTVFDAYLYAFPHDAPDHWPAGEGFARYFFQYAELPRFAYAHRVPATVRERCRRAAVAFNRSQRTVRVLPRYRNRPALLGIRARRHPFSPAFPCWGGYNWFSASSECVRFLTRWAREHPDVAGYYRRTVLPEESFFATVLHNSGRFRIANDCRRYVNWGRAVAHAISPATITANDVPRVLASGAHFARKFDMSVDARPFDLIDAAIG
jgi:hypothetical protein